MIDLKIKLALQEKLRDLRDEKKIKLSDLAEATGIPLSTLQRTEGQEDVRVGYQDITVLAKFYNVSADYLFGLTDNRQHRHIEIDTLNLSDTAIEVLKSEELNNRLLSEMIAHPDFPTLMNAVEIYIDRKVLPQMNTMNAVYKITENAIKDNYEVTKNDSIISLLKETVIDEDEYLRYRISERFNTIMKSLFDVHKKDALPDEQAGFIKDMEQALQDYPVKQEQEEKARWKMNFLAKQLGLNISELTEEEIQILMKALQKSKKIKQARRR